MLACEHGGETPQSSNGKLSLSLHPPDDQRGYRNAPLLLCLTTPPAGSQRGRDVESRDIGNHGPGAWISVIYDRVRPPFPATEVASTPTLHIIAVHMTLPPFPTWKVAQDAIYRAAAACKHSVVPRRMKTA
jgi:hypothetical protein